MNLKRLLTSSTSLAVASVFFCSCQEKASDNSKGQFEELRAQVEEIGSKVALISVHTSYLQNQSLSQHTLLYGIHDSEHKKVVGFIADSPPPQVGNFIVWDDDVYLVEAVRLHAQKKDEKKLDVTNPPRRAQVEVFVKFLSKLNPIEK